MSQLDTPARSDGDQIFGKGPPVRLGNKTHHIRMGFKALHYLEQRFGSIEAFIASLNQPGWGEDRVRSICLGMTAGLLHEKPTEMSVEGFEAYVEDGLDGSPNGLVDWINALATAVIEQWPSPSGRTLPKDPGSRQRSPGPSSTSGRRSRSGGRKKSSGR